MAPAAKRPILLFVLVGGCMAALLGAGAIAVVGWRVIESLQGPPYGSDGPHSGWRTEWAGDVDGDGAADVLVVTWFEPLPGGEYGCTRLFSSRTGELLWAHAGTRAWWADVHDAGDVNGDGKADLLIDDGERSRVIDVASDRTLLVLDGNDVWFFGPMRDIDGDGCGELFVRDAPAEDVKRVRVTSGKTGATLWSREAHDRVAISGLPEWFAWLGCVIGDVDRDGVEDVAVNTETSRLRVLSGASGATIREFGFEFDRCGELFRVGDLDGDGAADLAASGCGEPVRALSPSTGRELFAIKMDRYDSPRTVAAEADFDGDGVGDIALRRSSGLLAYSGVDGRRIAEFDYVTPADGAADIDGDGRAEILVMRNFYGEDAAKLGDDVWRAGSVEIRCVATGAIVRRWDSGSLEPLRKR